MEDTLVLGYEPSFAQMLERLATKLLVPIDSRLTSLEARRNQLQIIREMRKCYLRNDERLKTLACALDDAVYCQKAIDVLREEMRVFPNDFFEDCWDEDSGNLMIQITPQGFGYMTYDDLEGWFEDVEYAEPWYSLSSFLLLLNYGETEAEIWQKCSEHFGWTGFEEPPGLAMGRGIDQVFLRRYLKRHDLDYLFPAAELAFFPPNNTFFNCSNEDPDSEFFPFLAGEINYLKREWNKAKKLVDLYEIAAERVEAAPGVLNMFAEGLSLSQQTDSGRR